MSLLLRLFFAHILADFFFQTKWMVVGKCASGFRRWAILALHCLIHAVVAYLVVAQVELWQIPVVVFLTHFVIDAAKCSLPNDKPSVFLLDQVAHLVVIVALWLGLSPVSIGGIVAGIADCLPANIWALLIAYALVLRPASILMSLLLKKWTVADAAADSLPEAGKWIGYLERIMILTFIVTDNIIGVGFLLAAKSIFRFGDLNKAKDIKTTEYVMIGTMLSFAIAITLGLIVK